MKKRLFKTTIAFIVISAATFLTGCKESAQNQPSATEAQIIRQLKLEKMELKKEFDEKQAGYEKAIEQQNAQISDLQDQVTMLQDASKGGDMIIAELIQEVSKKEEKIAMLQLELFECQAKAQAPDEVPADTEPEEPAQQEKKAVSPESLQKLKELQQKAVQEKQ